MAKAKTVKTNAMRILDSNKIEHKELTYPVDKDHVDGVTVAHSIEEEEETPSTRIKIEKSVNSPSSRLFIGGSGLRIK